MTAISGDDGMALLSILTKFHKYLYSILSVLAIFGVIETLLTRGFFFQEPEIIRSVTFVFYTVSIILYVIWISAKVIISGRNLRELLPDLILSIVLIGMVFPVRVGGILVSFRIFLSLIAVFSKRSGISDVLSQLRLNPARLLLLSFLGVILVGGALLMLPAATVDQQGAKFIDAFFTSTSATCVTGLIVQDTGSFFSLFGQIVILILIQVGGLGIMTFSTLFAIILGRRIGLKQEEHIRGILEQSSTVETYRLIKQVIRITVIFELLGATFLLLRWMPVQGSHRAVYVALFHSISAFCNAGFSLYTQSLVDYAGDFYVNMIFIILIICGGLGFVVMYDLMRNCHKYNPFSIRWSRLTVHTRLVLITTVLLLITGTLTVFFFEFDNTMIGLSTGDKLLTAFFQSVTTRTAGFNTIDINNLKNVTLFIMILLMFIGASPSSTGGGIKTTTFAVLILSVRSLIMSRDKVEIFNRTIPSETVYKSIAILLFSATFLVILTMLLLATQAGRFIDIMFEAVSAMGTVGLSTGMTGRLTSAGKLLITILMYVGRVGPLTVALALSEVRKVNIAYPATRVSVG